MGVFVYVCLEKFMNDIWVGEGRKGRHISDVNGQGYIAIVMVVCGTVRWKIIQSG